MKLTITIPLSLMIFTAPLAADALTNWQKLCYSCHKEIAMGAKLQTYKGWETMFANKAEKLRARHANTPDALERLDTSYFKRYQRTLGNFLKEHGSDQGGLMRTCDGAATKC